MNDHASEEPKTETLDKQEDSSEKQPPKQAAKKKAKPSTKRRDSQKGNKAKAPKGGARSPRPFPADTLENAIKIAKAIKELNGGNPWPPSEVANAVSLGTSSSAFYYLSASARDYGLTVGTRDTEQIELNTIGRELVYATSAEIEREALRKAFLMWSFSNLCIAIIREALCLNSSFYKIRWRAYSRFNLNITRSFSTFTPKTVGFWIYRALTSN